MSRPTFDPDATDHEGAEPDQWRDPTPREAMRTARIGLLLAVAALPGSIVGLAVLVTTAATAWAVAFF